MFIKTINEDWLNLTKVDTFYTKDPSDIGWERYSIFFRYYGDRYDVWNFDTEKQRDEVYDGICEKFGTNIRYEK